MRDAGANGTAGLPLKLRGQYGTIGNLASYVKRLEEVRGRRTHQDLPARALPSPAPLAEESEPTAEPRDLAFVKASEVEREAVEWIWQGRLARGKITVLEGDPGTGKTTLALALAACISRGNPLPGEAHRTSHRHRLLRGRRHRRHPPAAPGSDRRRPRARRLREPPRPRVSPLHAAARPSPPWSGQSSSVTRHSSSSTRCLSYLDPDVDSHKDQAVRSALMPLAAMCQRTRVAVLLLRHLNKDSSKSALYRGGGSIAFAGVARLVMLAARDPDDEGGGYVLARTKGDLGRRPPALCYTIGSVGDSGVVLWGGESEHTADTLLAPTKPGPKPDTLDAAKRYLSDFLAGGPKLRSDVLEAAGKVGIAERTAYRAFEALEGESKAVGKRREWSLP